MSPVMMRVPGLSSRKPLKKTAYPPGNDSTPKRVILDSGPLGKIGHPRPNKEIENGKI